MIVQKPIGAVKVANMTHRLTIGKSVPDAVLKFWESTGQIESLKKSGAISDGAKKDSVKAEKKKSEQVNESIFQTEE